MGSNSRTDESIKKALRPLRIGLLFMGVVVFVFGVLGTYWYYHPNVAIPPTWTPQPTTRAASPTAVPPTPTPVPTATPLPFPVPPFATADYARKACFGTLCQNTKFTDVKEADGGNAVHVELPYPTLGICIQIPLPGNSLVLFRMDNTGRFDSGFNFGTIQICQNGNLRYFT